MAAPSPAARVRCLPPTSKTADSLVAAMSLTPSAVDWPTASACGLPPLIFTTAFPEVVATTWMSGSAAGQGTHASTRRMAARDLTSTPPRARAALIAEILELQRDVGYRLA